MEPIEIIQDRVNSLEKRVIKLENEQIKNNERIDSKQLTEQQKLEEENELRKTVCSISVQDLQMLAAIGFFLIFLVGLINSVYFLSTLMVL